jgi:hypothetical protein
MNMVKKFRRFAPLRFEVIQPIAEIDLSREVALPKGYYPTNPSFIDTGLGLLVCIRGVNYRFANECMLTPIFTTGSIHHSVYRFVLIDHRGSVTRALPDLDAAFEGAEDVRLFSFDGNLWGICSQLRCGPGLSSGMSLMKLDTDLRGATEIPLRSPYDFRTEKNWLPIVHQGALCFLYSVAPLVILRCDVASGTLDFLDPHYAEYPRSSFAFLSGGSASGITVANQQFLIVHRRTVRLPTLRKIYVHCCVTLSPLLDELRFGRYFVIGRAEVQFVAGMNMDDDVIRLSYGRMDRSAHLAEFDRRSFMRSLAP